MARIYDNKVTALGTQVEAFMDEGMFILFGENAPDALREFCYLMSVNPVNGTVLTSYAERYELVQAGQPLYQIASLDTLDLRVYISGAQLPSVNIGRQVEVLVDKNAEEDQSMHGTISWIASEAEFTPKTIQTKEERVTQVYAVKVRVPNPEGILKIGMPGEVNFGHRSSQVGTD